MANSIRSRFVVNDKKINKLLGYGVSLDLARKAVQAGLGVATIKNTSQKLLVNNYGMLPDEAKELAGAVKRKPVDDDVVQLLLERSSYTCAACKGATQNSGYIIHHIDSYEASQDNRYTNLIVLCPNHHDQAHRGGGGLTLGLTSGQLRKAKDNWEKRVEIASAQRAAQQIDVNTEAIDYFNIKRIEELCLGLFEKVPATKYSALLKQHGILDESGSFDEGFVEAHLSKGRYLFDYIGRGEALHYKALMEEIAKKVTFHDLNSASKFNLLQNIEGEYAFFIGGVTGKRPSLPIGKNTPPISLSYKKRNIRITWDLDPKFIYSMSAITRLGTKQRYIIYCLIRSVQRGEDGDILVSASPLLISMPNHYVNRKPAIAYQKDYDRYKAAGMIDDDE